MKRVLLATIASFALSSAAFAGGIDTTAPEVEVVNVSDFRVGPIVTGSIEVEVAENSTGEYAATTTVDVGIVTSGLAFGEIGVESIDGDTFEISKWYFGTSIAGGAGTISFGDHDGGVFIESYSDYSNIAAPEINEAIIVTYGDASAALGFADITANVGDVRNIQGAYSLDAGLAFVTLSADYNFDTEDYSIGTRTEGVVLGGVSLGSTLSYASVTETIAYEMDATMSYGLTAYVNGDDADALRNVGAGYERGIGNLTVFANVNYDVNAEEFAPKAGVSFNF
jgi:hypothetical protein